MDNSSQDYQSLLLCRYFLLFFKIAWVGKIGKLNLISFQDGQKWYTFFLIIPIMKPEFANYGEHSET